MEQEIILMNLEKTKEFTYKGKHCVISTVFIPNLNTNLMSNEWCCGYIECEDVNFESAIEEITARGSLKHLQIDNNKKYIGFDTAHSYNHDDPESQTEEAVELLIKKIIEEEM